MERFSRIIFIIENKNDFVGGIILFKELREVVCKAGIKSFTRTVDRRERCVFRTRLCKFLFEIIQITDPAAKRAVAEKDQQKGENVENDRQDCEKQPLADSY